MNRADDIINKLAKCRLKATPQRIAVLEALEHNRTHPTADDIYKYVERKMPSVSLGTVYKTLESFVEAGLAKKVQTENDVMRYDHVLDKHHHLYSSKTNRIFDYYDEELNNLLNEYFKKKRINSDGKKFKINDIRLNIFGDFES